jgi:hypothetical protein
MKIRESELQQGRRVAVVEDDHHFTRAGFIVHVDESIADSPHTGALGRFCQKRTSMVAYTNDRLWSTAEIGLV